MVVVAGVGLDIGDMHVLSDEFLAVARGGKGRGVLVEEVDLLEGESLGLKSAHGKSAYDSKSYQQAETYLGNAEEREDNTARACRAPNEEHLGLETCGARSNIDEVGCGVADGEVPEPVGRNSERHGLGTDVQGEDFTNDDPGDGAPCRSEGGNVDANEGNERLLARCVFDRDGDTDDGDEILADAHNDGTVDKEGTATEPLNTPHTGESHEDVHDVGGDLGQERVLDTRVGEEGSTV